MATASTLYPHVHRWRRWIRRNYIPDMVINGVVLLKAKGFKKTYVCFKCWAQSDTAQPKECKGMIGLIEEFNNAHSH